MITIVAGMIVCALVGCALIGFFKLYKIWKDGNSQF